MQPNIHELPKIVAALLRTVGPIHETARGGYFYSLSVVVTEENASRGFLIEQRLAQKGEPPSEGTGLSYKVPIKADPGSEPSYVFTESLPAALAYLERAKDTQP